MIYIIKIKDEYYYHHLDTTPDLYSAAIFKSVKSALRHLRNEQNRISTIISTLEERYNETGNEKDLKLIEVWTGYTKWYDGEVVEYELVPTGNNYLVPEES